MKRSMQMSSLTSLFGILLLVMTVLSTQWKDNDVDDSFDSFDWSEWSDISECSRTCDGGVAYKLRNCMNPSGCIGGNIKYSVCNIMKCKRDEDAWQADRQSMCEKYAHQLNAADSRQSTSFNASMFGARGVAYVWEAIMQTSDPCSLWCKGTPVKGGLEVMTKVKSRVPDGTRCDRRSKNMCVQGNCYSIGCEGEFGSPMVDDECGQCGGQGDQLNERTGRYCKFSEKLLKQIPYTSMAWRRGDFGPCSVNCGTGEQTTEVKCINRNSGHTVDSSLCMSLNMPAPLTRVCYRKLCNFNWRGGVWRPCTTQCGNGTRRRDIFCAIGGTEHNNRDKSYNGDKKRIDMPIHVANFYCDDNKKLPSIISCSGDTCETTYATSSRNEFKSLLSRHKKVVIPNIQIPVFTLSRIRQRISNKASLVVRKKGSYYYSMGNWSACSKRCTPGLKRRDYKCMTFDEIEINLPINMCAKLERPSILEVCLEACTPRVNDGFEWRYRMHSSCNTTCGYGIRLPIFVCINLYRERPDLMSLCNGERKPYMADRFCDGEKRLCPPRWVFPNTREFDTCSRVCGAGTMSRIVQCQQITPISSTKIKRIKLHDRKCPLPIPARKKTCNKFNCPAYWKGDKFSACSVSCGKGTRKRMVHCLQHDVDLEQVVRREDSACNHAIEPSAFSKCNSGPCPTRAPKPHQFIFQDANTTFYQMLPQRRVVVLVGGKVSLIDTTSITVKCHCKNFKRKDIVWTHLGKVIGRTIINKTRAAKGYLWIKRGGYDNVGRYICHAGNLTAGIDIDYHSKYTSIGMVHDRRHIMFYNQAFEKKLQNELIRRENKRRQKKKKRKNKNSKKFRYSHKVFTLTNIKRLARGFKNVPFHYYIGNWSKCSKSCGHGGVIYRDIICEVVFQKYLIQVPTKYCIDNIKGYPPLESEDCFLTACPQWYVGQWIEYCSSIKCPRIGYGVHLRRLYCRGANDEYFPTGMCAPDKKPTKYKECKNSNCYVTWKIFAWGECSPACSSNPRKVSIQTRTVSCVWKTTHAAAGLLCRNLSTPATTRNCKVPNCKSYVCIDRIGKPNNGFTKECSRYFRHRNACKNNNIVKNCCRTCTIINHLKRQRNKNAN